MPCTEGFFPANAGLRTRRYLAAPCPEVAPDGAEITDARWLHWQWLGQRQGWLQRPQLHPQPQSTGFSFPGRSSLANRMLTRWIAECAAEWPGAAVPDCDIDEATCAPHLPPRCTPPATTPSKTIRCAPAGSSTS